MTRDFLKSIGIEDNSIDKILDENMKDIGKEKRNTDSAETKLNTANDALKEAESKLATAQKDLETLKKANGDTAGLQKKLDDLQAKYDADIAERDTKLADRDYSDAINRAISEKIPHGFKGGELAKQGFLAALREKKLELKDGQLVGFDDFLKAQKETNPEAFESDKPAPKIVSPTGSGGAPAAPVSRAAQIAAQYNANLYGSPTKKE